jgi:hypothetical protein
MVKMCPDTAPKRLGPVSTWTLRGAIGDDIVVNGYLPLSCLGAPAWGTAGLPRLAGASSLPSAVGVHVAAALSAATRRDGQ